MISLLWILTFNLAVIRTFISFLVSFFHDTKGELVDGKFYSFVYFFEIHIFVRLELLNQTFYVHCTLRNRRYTLEQYTFLPYDAIYYVHNVVASSYLGGVGPTNG